MGADNSVYVTGYSRGTSLIYDAATIKYFQCSLAADAGDDTTIYIGYGSGTAVLTANVQGAAGSVTYLWSNNATTQTIVVSPQQTTSYWVRITDSKGCMSTDTVIVNVINVSCGNNNNKVLVCHNGHTICISENAVPAHLTQHEGDYLGPCVGDQIANVENADKFMLYSNYPNPFNPVTSIKFDVPIETSVKLIIYDALGREVTVLVNGKLKPGSHSVTWNAEGYASGIYFYKLESEEFTEIRKMVLMK
ncbi:MAG: T9SS type A sorting domain-containing protein [Chlorobi bacterium]|nr:T9SS type A sorting domain-containing protein [Chlorobiota bacterium]MCI0715711.1 T9SS type A sorting domain-containing protein [Chlorobiota bacterium]